MAGIIRSSAIHHAELVFTGKRPGSVLSGLGYELEVGELVSGSADSGERGSLAVIGQKFARWSLAVVGCWSLTYLLVIPGEYLTTKIKLPRYNRFEWNITGLNGI
ncbi:hypothetical protein CEXT_238321 [Caerostris extrusa]|uniref:Uncharacterized protein n=1 Tax=Caerostris extrusa TaxID=172846 RepID=A0AAV4T5G8_CAEEX|nr:hypothetical protein CEXT_238321 [Caerostris extrusa]